MKRTFHALSLLVAALSLTSCPDSAGPGGGAVGPYDAQGNYVEAWADDPSKWRHPARDVTGTTAVAKNDPVPTNMTPLPPGRSPEIILPPSKPVSSTPKPTTREIASNSSTRPKASATGSSGTRSTTARTTSKPKPTVAKTTSKPKPKPKPAPTTVRHTIKKGDTLSGLASKYGTSVSAIQKANGISGTMIREGKSLVIPRKK